MYISFVKNLDVLQLNGLPVWCDEFIISICQLCWTHPYFHIIKSMKCPSRTCKIESKSLCCASRFKQSKVAQIFLVYCWKKTLKSILEVSILNIQDLPRIKSKHMFLSTKRCSVWKQFWFLENMCAKRNFAARHFTPQIRHFLVRLGWSGEILFTF